MALADCQYFRRGRDFYRFGTLGHESGEVHPDGVEIRTTNNELSGLADISRFTASRALSGWVRSGTITKGRGRILLHSPEALLVD